jgi:hypothetical protein
MDLLTFDWRAVKLFLAGWGVSAFFWIPLTILLMRVMASMGVAQNTKAMRFMATPTWAARASNRLHHFIYGGWDE